MRHVEDRLRRTAGQRPAGWVASTSFVAEAGRIVEALRLMRLRVSLYVMRFEGLSAALAAKLVEEAVGDGALVGRLPDRSVGLLLIDSAADTPAARRASLAKRLAARLSSRGTKAGELGIRLSERHGWTDEFEAVAHVVEDMMDEPAFALPPLRGRLDG